LGAQAFERMADARRAFRMAGAGVINAALVIDDFHGDSAFGRLRITYFQFILRFGGRTLKWAKIIH
jgi:hypothetical protein